jgi:hypothetical protein
MAKGRSKSMTTAHKPRKPAQPKYDFDADLDYFIANQDELVAQYNGKVLLIRNQHVEGAYDTVGEACSAGDKLFGRGKFSIRTCMPGEDAYTDIITRVDFSRGN